MPIASPLPRASRIRPIAAVHAAAHRDWESGLAAGRRGDWHAAERAFARAADATPHDGLMWLNLAHARHRLDAIEGALEAIERALACDPGSEVARRLAVDLWSRRFAARGPAGAQLADLPASIRRDAAMLAAIGERLWAIRRTVDAVQVMMAALVLAPARVESHEMLMYCLRDLGLKAEAAECAKTVLALGPDRLSVRMHMLFDRQGAAAWSELDTAVQRLVRDLADQPADAALPLPALTLLPVDVPPSIQRRAAEIAARCVCAGAQPLPAPVPAQRRPGPLRIGFMSYDFREHPVAQLLAETVEQLDRARCEVVLYAHGAGDDSAWRQRLRQGADRFVDCGDDDDRQIAQRIRGDAIDVLVELGGHTRGNRLGVLAHRPAAVQVSFLGFPGSTGVPEIDYLVGDPWVTPLDHADDFSEQLAQLPCCLLPASRHRPLPQAMSRAQLGLPEDALVLCAFNEPYKLQPKTFEIWCEALRSAPQVVLWLKATNDQLVHNLRRRAAEAGVDPARLVFAPNRVPYADHFSRLAQADLFVDNWPYNAHTTASDALWAGLPVLTLRQRGFASRVAASLLHGAGLDSFICDSVEAYRQGLLDLVRDPAPLREAREWLQAQRLHLPIFDSGAFAGALLGLFERMHTRWRAGLSPAHLAAEAASQAGSGAGSARN